MNNLVVRIFIYEKNGSNAYDIVFIIYSYFYVKK